MNKQKEYHKEYYQRPEVVLRQKAYCKQYALEHKEACTKAVKKYRNKLLTKKKRAEYGKLYRSKEDVQERTRVTSAKWRKENREKCRIASKVHYQTRKENPLFKLHCSIRTAICKSIKKRDLSKNRLKWETMVGYTSAELKQCLEKLFVDGMSWENYGSWHIDHILPVSFFEFSSFADVEFRMCWRLENLQPLWAKDNMKKYNKVSLRLTG